MASRPQLVTYPKFPKPVELVVVVKEDVFYRHSVPAGETDFIVKVPVRGEFAVVILDNDKPVAGVNGSDIQLQTLEIELPKKPEPATVEVSTAPTLDKPNTVKVEPKAEVVPDSAA